MNIEQETALNIAKLETEREIERAEKCLKHLKGDNRILMEEFIKDAKGIHEMLTQYESRDGRFRKLKRTKVIAKLTYRLTRFKRKWKKVKWEDIDMKTAKIMGGN